MKMVSTCPFENEDSLLFKQFKSRLWDIPKNWYAAFIVENSLVMPKTALVINTACLELVRLEEEESSEIEVALVII